MILSFVDAEMGPYTRRLVPAAKAPGVYETRLVGPSGAAARLGGLRAVCDSSGVRPCLRALGMNRPGVRGDAGLAPAVGLIRSLSALSA